jgi:hypothetical protein
MVSRRSTVRFRKGAPGCGEFSNLEPSTSLSRVPIECQAARFSACAAQRFLFREEVWGVAMADGRLSPTAAGAWLGKESAMG